MSTDMSLWSLVSEASGLVQFVMLLLLLASVLSWAVILRKERTLRRAAADAERFEKQFWSGINLGDLYSRLSHRPKEREGLEAIFEAGFREFSRLHKNQPGDTTLLLEGAGRSMRVSLTRELDRLEEHLSFLASVGSISPFIGLFGTVWGIMNAFRGLANVQQATLSMVAPGIAEALVATAMGLFAAIPAVMAYNRYITRVDRLTSRYESFMEEFVSFLQRHSAQTRGGEAAA